MEARRAPHDDDEELRGGSTKRRRVMLVMGNDEHEHEHEPIDRHNHQLATASTQCSVQEFLSVPLHVIFRRQDGGRRRRHKPLMTRAEAHTLLSITELARELDMLVDLSSQALERQVQSRMITSEIQDIPTFRSLIPSLVVYGQHIPQQALIHLQLELDRILASCQACASTLKQFSEQNWTMSDSLLDAFGPDDVRGHTLAKEKRGLSDLEEELSKRLDHLSSNSAASKEAIFGDYNQEALSMATLANRLFDIKEASAPKRATSPADEPVGASENNDTLPTTPTTPADDIDDIDLEDSNTNLPEGEEQAHISSSSGDAPATAEKTRTQESLVPGPLAPANIASPRAKPRQTLADMITSATNSQIELAEEDDDDPEQAVPAVSKEAIFGDYHQEAVSMATLANRLFDINDASAPKRATSPADEPTEASEKNDTLSTPPPPTTTTPADDDIDAEDSNTNLPEEEEQAQISSSNENAPATAEKTCTQKSLMPGTITSSKKPLASANSTSPRAKPRPTLADMITSATNLPMELSQEDYNDVPEQAAVVVSQGSPRKADTALTLTTLYKNNNSRRQVTNAHDAVEASDESSCNEQVMADVSMVEDERLASSDAGINVDATGTTITTLPPLAYGEYDTLLPTVKGRVMMNMKSYIKDGTTLFNGYTRFQDGLKAPAELRSLGGTIGDRIMAVDGVCVLGKNHEEIVAFLRERSKNKQVHIRWLQSKLKKSPTSSSVLRPTEEGKRVIGMEQRKKHIVTSSSADGSKNDDGNGNHQAPVIGDGQRKSRSVSLTSSSSNQHAGKVLDSEETASTQEAANAAETVYHKVGPPAGAMEVDSTLASSDDAASSDAEAIANITTMLPPLAPGEHDTLLPSTKNGFMIKLRCEVREGIAHFNGYRRFQNGLKAPAELRNICAGYIGDRIVAVNGISLLGKQQKEILDIFLERTKSDKVHIRFRPALAESAPLAVTDPPSTTDGTRASTSSTCREQKGNGVMPPSDSHLTSLSMAAHSLNQADVVAVVEECRSSTIKPTSHLDRN